jgi:threonine dehydrogenase-like Zn-dependent dehydrogenase
MTTTATVAVITGPGTIEFRNVPLPALGPEDAIVKVETNGICGTDLELLRGELSGVSFPVVPGHEPVGVITDIGAGARQRLGVDIGDRVVVNSAIGQPKTGFHSYGTLSPELPPGLWGGLATHLFLSSSSTVIPMSRGIPLAEAAFHNPLANGFQWTVVSGGMQAGAVVVILGPGPRGIACALAALHAGAAHVTLVGLPQDAARLELAKDLGVHHTIQASNGEPASLRDALITDRPSLVVDTTPHAGAPAIQAITAVANGGTVVLAGIKSPSARLDLPVNEIVLRRLTLRGPVSKTLDALRTAVGAIESRSLPLDRLTTAAYPLSATAEAINSFQDTSPARPLHVRVEPQLAD